MGRPPAAGCCSMGAEHDRACIPGSKDHNADECRMSPSDRHNELLAGDLEWAVADIVSSAAVAKTSLFLPAPALAWINVKLARVDDASPEQRPKSTEIST